MLSDARRIIFCAALFAPVYFGSPARGARLDYYLTVDIVSHTWELAASTDSPGGIGAIVVNIQYPGTGICVAPRSLKGFTVYNQWRDQTFSGVLLGQQAFAAQLPGDGSNIVYGVGYIPVSNADFGVVPPFEMVGSAQTMPTVFYTGSWDPIYNPTPIFHPDQPSVAGSVYLSLPPPGGYEKPIVPSEITRTPEIVAFHTQIVPEPAAWLSIMIGLLPSSIAQRVLKNRLRPSPA
jgi:hypothetical protein